MTKRLSKRLYVVSAVNDKKPSATADGLSDRRADGGTLPCSRYKTTMTTVQKLEHPHQK